MPELLLNALVVVLSLAVSAGAGYPVTVLVLRWADRGSGRVTGAAGSAPSDPEPEAGSDDPSEPQPGPPGTQQEQPASQDPAQILRGGTWIGILERLAVTAAILASYPAAIAVVVAIKGLGRFPELRMAHGVSERFIIGTLCSGLWAAAVGLAATGVLEAIG